MIHKFIWAAFLISSSANAGEAISRHLEAALDLVALMSASCVQHYEEGLTPKAVAALQFSQGQIAAYCVCSTKLVVQDLEDADFKSLEAGNDLPAKFSPRLKQAHFDCARKVWAQSSGVKKGR
jgi:hypothetical protein